MNKTKVIIAFLFVANIVFLIYVQNRRANSSKFSQKSVGQEIPHKWNVTLSERTTEDRERILSAAFALSDFDIKPLETASEVVIPRPMKWFEEMIISTSYVSIPVSERGSKQSSVANAKLPWQGGPVNVAMRSICMIAYESEAGPASNQVLVKEKLVGLDTYIAKNGVEVPATDLFAVGRYLIDDKANTLLTTQKAVQINGQSQPRYQADVPQWLVPARRLVVGESWVQSGTHPDGIPSTAPLPEATRKFARLVLFEGRRAAEIETTSVFYDFVPGPTILHLKHQEKTLTYLDLETGEPLWFETKIKNEGEFESVARGCNQMFVKHLIQTKPKD